MKKIITLLVLMFIVSTSFAQYTPMTAAGYQFKRILCDSTLHIPSFCGIPTLRNSTAKNGAIAMDTCNYKIYMWTNAGGWGEIIGAGTDTTSLSNRIDQRVKYTDTASMLSKYLRIIDTTNKFVANVTRVNDTTIRVFKGNTITDLKILGKGTDTTSLSTRIDARVKYTDTAAMLLPYLRKVDTTAMLSKYLRKTDTASLSNRINLKLNISDTATMLSKYLRKTDTTNRFVNAVTKVNDSTIRVFKGSTSTDIELPRGSGGGGGSGTVTNVGTGYGLSGGPITSTGTIIVDSATLSIKYLRRADTSNLVATKSNLALKLSIADTATMLSKYLRKTDTASLSNRINLKVNISDTATMLSKYLRKTDTASLSNRINLKVNISDTATMLSKYLRKTDTASLSNRINLKLNITDTTNKFVNNVTKINDSTIRVWKGTSSTDLLIRGNASGGSGSQNLQQVTDLGNTTTNALIVDDGLSQITKVGFTDYLNNLVYPIRYSNVFGGSFDLKDDLSGLPPFLNGYSSTYGDAFYKMGIESNKAILQVNGGSLTSNSNIKLTENELQFTEGGNTTSIKTNPTGNSASYFLPANNGTDQNLLADAPNDASKYVRQLGTWVTITEGGTGTVQSITQGYGITASPTNPITTTGTLDVDTTTSGLSGKYLRIVDTTGKWASATASFVPYTGATLNVNLGDKTLKGEAIYAKESFFLRDTTLSGNYLVIQKDGDKGAILFANNSGGGLNGNVSLSVNNMSGLGRSINLPDSNGTVALKEYTIDSLKRSADSVYARKNGQWNFQYKDSVGSGGGGGGGSAISYYLNGSISQGTIGGVAYKQLKVTPVIGAGTDFTINADGYIAQFITDVASPNKTLIPGGNWNFETYFSASSSGGSPSFYVELYKYDGTTFTLIASNSGTPESITGGTSIDLYFSALAVPTTLLSSSDRIAVRFFVTHSGRTITMHTENSHLSQIITTFPSGITELNGLTAQVQNFATGTSGTDFGISSSTATHTFNLPDASATNRGALTSANWTTFNNKIGASDTSVFQRKSISANTIMANNTASAANVTAQAYYDVAEQAMGNTITWTGTAPTSLTSANYAWQQVGKTVTMQFNALYANAGVSNTGYFFTLPSDMPLPAVPTGWTGASGYLYTGSASTHNTAATINSNVAISYIRRNAANTAFEVGFIGTGVSARGFKINIIYKAQ